MFQVRDRAKQTVMTVFGVHKSGPLDEQTKFLVHDGTAWRWEWATRFEPFEVAMVKPRARFAGAVA